MLSLLTSLIINLPTSPIELPMYAQVSDACAGLDVGESATSEEGICVYSLGKYGWYYVKNGKSYGATCTLSDKWCEGFSSKEDAIKASKSN